MVPQLINHSSEISVEYKEDLDLAGNPVVSELCNSAWWKSTEAALRRRTSDESCLLPILLYIDGTQLDVTGKQSAKPICITLGNFSGNLRVCFIYMISNSVLQNSEFTKRCVGYCQELDKSRVEICCSVRKNCNAKGISISEDSLDCLMRLLKRHVQNSVLADLFQRLDMLYRDGLILSFLGDKKRR